MLSEKRVVVTGASGGIGREVSHMLYQSGVELVLIGRDAKALDALAEDLKKKSPGRDRIHVISADFRIVKPLEALIDMACRLLGRSLNVLVNNAGIAFHCPVEKVNGEELEEVFKVNAIAPILLASKAFEVMRRNGGGHIINVTSALGRRAMAKTGTYTASKHALSGFSKVLRIEGAAFDIGVSQVEFGAVDTGFLDRTHDEETLSWFTSRNIRRIPPRVAAEWILQVINTSPSVCPELISVLPAEQLI